MADPLSALGGVAAALQIAAGLAKTVNSLNNYIQLLRKAPDEIQSFRTQAMAFSGNLDMFYDLSMEHMSQLSEEHQDEVMFRKLIIALLIQSRRVEAGMTKLLTKLKSRGVTKDAPFAERIINELLWLFSQSPVKHLRKELDSATLAMCLFIANIQWAKRERKLRKAALSLEGQLALQLQIDTLKTQIATLLPVTMSQRKELRDFEQKNVAPGERATDDQTIEAAIKSLEETLTTKLKHDNFNPDAVEVEGDAPTRPALELSDNGHEEPGASPPHRTLRQVQYQILAAIVRDTLSHQP